MARQWEVNIVYTLLDQHLIRLNRVLWVGVDFKRQAAPLWSDSLLTTEVQFNFVSSLPEGAKTSLILSPWNFWHDWQSMIFFIAIFFHLDNLKSYRYNNCQKNISRYSILSCHRPGLMWSVFIMRCWHIKKQNNVPNMPTNEFVHTFKMILHLYASFYRNSIYHHSINNNYCP